MNIYQLVTLSLLTWSITHITKSDLSPSQKSSSSPQEISATQDIWKLLLKVKYTYDKAAYIPQFDEKIKALDGKTVTIRGYMYPLEEQPKHEFFMLSYYPINVCFFCGGAGPESVVEVSAAEPLKIRDKPVDLRGKLRLNYHDRDRLFFILLNAKIVE